MANLYAPPSKDELSNALMAAPPADELRAHTLPTPKSKAGVLESTLRGVEQGATLGFGDEINGGLEALLNSVTGGDKGLSLLDAYRKHRDESRDNFKEAEDSHPWASGIGNLAGAIAPAALTGGASLAEQGLGKVAAAGAAYGAASGLGNSKADLTKGDVAGAGKDVAVGGLIGAATAPLAQKVTEEMAGPVGKLVDKLKTAGESVADLGPISSTIEAFKQGAVNNRNLWGNKANKALNQEIIGATGEVGTELQDALSTATKSKMDLLASEGPKVDLKDWYGNALATLKNLKNKYAQNGAVADDLSKVQDLIANHIFGVEEEGIPGKGLHFSTEDAENLLRQLGGLGSQGDASLKTNEGKALVNRLISPLERDPNLIERAMNLPENYSSLGELVSGSRQGLPEANSKISQLLTAKEAAPSITDIVNSEKNSTGGINAADRVSNFLKSLPDDLKAKYGDKIEDLANAKHVADLIAAPGLSKGLVEKVVHNSVYGGANWAGLGARAMYDMTPEALKAFSANVAGMGGQAAQNLGRILGQAADKDQIGRNALFFALQQNPEYRKILREATGEHEQVK